MAFELPSPARTTDGRPAWSGMAVLVEAMVLLVFLIASLAVVTQLFAASAIRAREGERLAAAIALATDTAERFAADPAHAEGSQVADDLTVSCEVSSVPGTAGTRYDATITVTQTDAADADPVYELTTSRYQREVD